MANCGPLIRPWYCAHITTIGVVCYGHHEVGLLVFFLFPSCCTTHCESFRSHYLPSSSWSKCLIKWVFLVNETCIIKIKTDAFPPEFEPKFVSVNLPTKTILNFLSVSVISPFFLERQWWYPSSFMYLRTVRFNTYCIPASSCPRVEVNDPTVACRFQIVCFISRLSPSSSFCSFPIFNFLLSSGGVFAVDIDLLQCLYTVA